ncbi:MAG: hypothetical protein U0703_08925 [Anaerolineae bacterium]
MSSTSVVRPIARASSSTAAISRVAIPCRRALLSTSTFCTSARCKPFGCIASTRCTQPRICSPSNAASTIRWLAPTSPATRSQNAAATPVSSGAMKLTDEPWSTTSRSSSIKAD